MFNAVPRIKQRGYTMAWISEVEKDILNKSLQSGHSIYSECVLRGMDKETIIQLLDLLEEFFHD